MTLKFNPYSALRMLLATMLMTLATISWAVYPEKPVRLVVPFAPGGGTDSIARALGIGLAQELGQPVIVENKPGAGTIIGTDAVAKSPADGYSAVVATFAHAINPSLMAKLPYDPEKAFAPVLLIAKGPNVLVVRKASPYVSVKGLLEAAKAKPGRLSFGSQGNGTSAHLAGEMFENLAQVKLTHVPYRGAGPAMTDLLGGQIDMMFATAAAVAPHIASGNLRALAVTTAERTPALKGVPSVGEVVPGYSVESWYGLFVPAGTPHDVIAKLNAAAKKAAQSAAFKKKLEPEGLQVGTGTPAEFDQYVKREEQRWKKIIKENNIQPD